LGWHEVPACAVIIHSAWIFSAAWRYSQVVLDKQAKPQDLSPLDRVFRMVKFSDASPERWDDRADSG
jgi:hypothetical protein